MRKSCKANPLRVGLSMKVKVDIAGAGSGKNMTAAADKNVESPAKLKA